MTEITEQVNEVDGATKVNLGNQAKPILKVKVYASFEVFFDGEAYSVSAENAVGPFDVLPKHHNFLCMLVPCDIKIETKEGVKTVKVSRALMHVHADHVTVFVNV